MLTSRTAAILVLAGAALLSAGASAQQGPAQGSPPATGQTGPCPAMTPGQQANGMPMQAMPHGQMSGQAGGQMGAQMGPMSPQAMQDMHAMRTEMAALRAEMKELREQLGKAR